MNDQELTKEIQVAYYEKQKILQRLFAIPQLRGKIFVAGGLVSAIVSKQFSTRFNDDIDIVMRKEDRSDVKDTLIYPNGAKITYDSLLASGGDKEDRGFEMVLNGIKIVFYPFTITDERVVHIDAPNIRDGKLDLSPITFKLAPNVELTTKTTMHIVDPNNPANTEDLEDVGILEPAIEALIKWGKLGDQNLDVTQKQKNQQDLMQLSRYVDSTKVEALRQANDSGEAIVNAGEQASQNVEEQGGFSLAKGRRTPRGAAAAYVDALVLAFITGIVGGLFLFIFLRAIQ